MDWKLELVALPVSDVGRAKAFYTDQVGFNADHDHQVSDEIRFVQGSADGSAGSAHACRPAGMRALVGGWGASCALWGK